MMKCSQPLARFVRGCRKLGQGNERGVTFVEIMLVVVITGIIAALATPNVVSELERIRFRGQARDLVSRMREARSYAITNKGAYGVSFDLFRATATLFKDKVVTSPAQLNGGDSVIRVDTLRGKIPFVFSSFTGAAVVFQPNGSANQSGYVWLLSYNDAGSGASATYMAGLSVLAATGRVRLDTTYYY